MGEHEVGEVVELLIDGRFYYAQYVGTYWFLSSDVLAVLDVSPDRPLDEPELDAALARSPRYVQASFYDDLIESQAFQRFRGVRRLIVPPGTGPDRFDGLSEAFGDHPGVSGAGMFLDKLSTGFTRGHELEWYQRNAEQAGTDEVDRKFWGLHAFRIFIEDGASEIADRLRALGYVPTIVLLEAMPEVEGADSRHMWRIEANARERDGSDLDEPTIRRIMAGLGPGVMYDLDTFFVGDQDPPG